MPVEPDGCTHLPALAEIFHALRRGRHICASDGALYVHLCTHFAAYQTLLAELGFVLQRHTRDFFYLEDRSHFTELAGKMALFVFVLVECLADQGVPVEETLMTATFPLADLPHLQGERYRNLMREAEVTTPEQLAAIVQNLERYGFARRLPDDGFAFQAPAYRFLDLCLAYAEKTSRDQEQVAESEVEDA